MIVRWIDVVRDTVRARRCVDALASAVMEHAQTCAKPVSTAFRAGCDQAAVCPCGWWVQIRYVNATAVPTFSAAVRR